MGLTRRIDTLFGGSGNWTALAEDVLVKGWGAGGWGSNAGGAGAGAGAAYGEKLIEGLTLSSSIPYTVGQGGTSGSEDGGDTTFVNSSTFLVKGGKGKNNGGTGGQATECVADQAYDGGDGGSGGAQIGGGAAGDIENATGSASGRNFGSNAPVSAGNTLVSGWPAGGGGSGGTDVPGSDGILYIEYDYEVGDFPIVVDRKWSKMNSADNELAVPLSAQREAGDLLIVIVTKSDDENFNAVTGWNLAQQADGTNVMSQAHYWRRATGDSSDEALITWAGNEEATIVCLTIRNAGDPEFTIASGNSSNANPPSITPSGGEDDYLFIATAGWDGSDAGFANSSVAPPSGYGDFVYMPTTTGGRAAMAISEKRGTASSEDPGTFTSQSEQWVAGTIAIPFVTGTIIQECNEQFGFRSSMSRTASLTRTLVEVIQWQDSLVKFRVFIRNLVEQMAFRSGMKKGLARTLRESIEWVDRKRFSLTRRLTETIGWDDNLSTVRVLIRRLTEKMRFKGKLSAIKPVKIVFQVIVKLLKAASKITLFSAKSNVDIPPSSSEVELEGGESNINLK